MAERYGGITMILWLDDIRPPWKYGYHCAEWAKTYEHAIELLKTGNVSMASLDHDLSEAAIWGMQPEGEKTGYDVLLWIKANNAWPVDGIKIHTMNPEGMRKMKKLVEDHYGGALVVPEWEP